MNRSMIFTIFCFITAVLVLIHMVKDINNANIVYLNILMQLSFMVVLIDIGVHAKDMQSSKLQEKKSPIPNYHFIASTLGIITMCFSLVAQSFVA